MLKLKGGMLSENDRNLQNGLPDFQSLARGLTELNKGLLSDLRASLTVC